jgi:3-oxoacyl-[acyl-carrier protein] reductase
MAKPAILVTGASRGIGRATAERLSNGGYEVIGLARTAGEDKFPGHFFPADLSDPAATAAALSQVTSNFEILASSTIWDSTFSSRWVRSISKILRA